MVRGGQQSCPMPEVVIHLLNLPDVCESARDDKVLLLGEQPDSMIVLGNEARRYFGIHTSALKGRTLAVDTTDPQKGTVLLDPETMTLGVQVEQAWSIEVTAR